MDYDGNKTALEAPDGDKKAADSLRGQIKIINAKRYKVLKYFSVSSAEADIFLISGDNGEERILKLYRPGIEPKREILELIKSLPEDIVVKLIETGTDEDGRFYEIQKYAKYGSLADYIKDNSPLSEAFIIKFILKLNECLRQIHSKNIIHRDIKPSNILIKRIEPLEIVITDFGIASVSDMSLHQTSLNRTIKYSAPETMTGIVSKGSDYWSMGIILLEMILGSHPFEGYEPQTISYTITTGDVPGIERISSRYADLAGGLLCRNDKVRWNYEDVMRWLENLMDSKKSAPAAAEEPESPLESRRPNIVLRATAGIYEIALPVYISYYFQAYWVSPLVLILYFVYFASSEINHGATFFKRLFRIRVVNKNGDNPSFYNILLRFANNPLVLMGLVWPAFCNLSLIIMFNLSGRPDDIETIIKFNYFMGIIAGIWLAGNAAYFIINKKAYYDSLSETFIVRN